MKHPITIIKIGGAVLEDEEQLNVLLCHFSAIQGYKMLVHGGGRHATQVAAELGIDTKMIHGRRVTDSAMIEVVIMVYGGLVNKRVVAGLQARGINAIGLTGADADIIRAHCRPIKDNIDYGWVGDIDFVNGSRLQQLIESDLTPVLAPLSHDAEGQLLNTNADTIAAETAKALADIYDVTLVYCFEKAGVLARPDDESSIIPFITRQLFERQLSEGIISGGMIPKLQNAFSAIDSGVTRVIITGATAADWEKGTVVRTE